MSTHNEPTSRSLFLDAGGMYAAGFVLVLALALVATGVGWVSANLYALVAAVFLGLPHWWMSRKELDPEGFGMTMERWAKSAAWGALFTAGTVPLFVVGQYVWEAEIRGREVTFDTERYLRWDPALEEHPKRWGRLPGVWVWTQRDAVILGTKSAPSSSGRIILEAPEPFTPRPRNDGIIVRPVDEHLAVVRRQEREAQPGQRRWEVLPTTIKQGVSIVIDRDDIPTSLSIRVLPLMPNIAWPLHKGPQAEVVEGGELELERTAWWMVLWALTQVFFIALPEEYFYRGYIQTRLAQGFGRRRQERAGADAGEGEVLEERAWLGFTPSIFWTSILFGLGHLLIPVGGVLVAQRFLVFFPSLLFGWLRRRTGSLAGSVLYHACCNLMVLYGSVHYA
ncbi:MAG: MrtP family glutamic-type intramembrane protease [Myxococcota bacterium]